MSVIYDAAQDRAWDARLLRLQAVLAGPGLSVAKDIVEQGLDIIGMLLDKNAAYGNSALHPIRIFAKGIDTVAQLNVRLDDKLSRIARGHDFGDEDVDLDLIGYLILRRIANRSNS